MTYTEMGRLADIMLRSGGRPHKLLTDREEKLAVPLLTFVIVLFGAPLATSTKRGGTAYGIGMALFSTILYLLFFRLSTGLGETGAMEPLHRRLAPEFLFPCGRPRSPGTGPDLSGSCAPPPATSAEPLGQFLQEGLRQLTCIHQLHRTLQPDGHLRGDSDAEAATLHFHGDPPRGDEALPDG